MKLYMILLCILLMCCGAMGAHAESEQEYALFAVRNGNYLVQAVALDMRSIITLTAGGHGSVTFDEDNMEIAEWALDGEALSLILADGNAVTGLLSGGILQLDLYGTGEMILCYALPGADTSAFPAMSYDEFMAQYAADQAAPDSRLHALSQNLDTGTGVHMIYTVFHEYIGTEEVYTVQGRGGLYYSLRVIPMADAEGHSTAVLFRDGVAYSLSPKKGTATKVTSAGSDAISQDALMMDTLYAAIRENAGRTDFTRETREMDGQTLEAEIFPARNAYQSTYVFSFDRDGRLVTCEEIHPESAGIRLGTSVYTIRVMDANVDDTLFELTGYTVSE